jgi:hypothetical protein
VGLLKWLGSPTAPEQKRPEAFTVWSLHIDDNDTFETTLHGSREEAVAARRAFVIDQEYDLSDHPDDTDYTSDGELVTVITEHTVSPPNE